MNRLLHWLVDPISCKRFARHVSSGVIPLGGGLSGRFHFWMHWFVCPLCRRYWKEIQALGHVQRSNAALDHHPNIRLDELKHRIRERLTRRYA